VALNALRTDDRLAEAHAAMGHIKGQYDYDWAGAEREYQQAIELNPNYATVHHCYALYLSERGHLEIAVVIRSVRKNIRCGLQSAILREM
jgi:Tfp pilus assembly protein PilF